MSGTLKFIPSFLRATLGMPADDKHCPTGDKPPLYRTKKWLARLFEARPEVFGDVVTTIRYLLRPTLIQVHSTFPLFITTLFVVLATYCPLLSISLYSCWHLFLRGRFIFTLSWIYILVEVDHWRYSNKPHLAAAAQTLVGRKLWFGVGFWSGGNWFDC